MPNSDLSPSASSNPGPSDGENILAALESLAGLIIPNPVTKMAADIEGIEAAPGLVMGRAVVVPPGALSDEENRTIPDSQVSAELEKARVALREVAQNLMASDVDEHPVLQLIGAQLEEERWPQIELAISKLRLSAAKAIRIAFLPTLESMRSAELKGEVEGVVRSLTRRVHENAGTAQQLDQIPPNSILVSDDFNATSLRPIGPKENIIAIVTDAGGRMGHVPIYARSKGWPAVTDAKDATAKIKNGDLLIIDGSIGKVWINPNSDICEWFKRESAKRIPTTDLRAVPSNRVTTLDRREIKLSCNIDTAADLAKVASVFPVGMREIKLFRTEEDLLQGRGFNSAGLIRDEETQALIYRRAVKICGSNGATIRTVDWGGEKSPTGRRLANPALGPRGIRYSLMNPDTLMIQLRAACRASSEGPVRIMAPMVTEAQEIVELQAYLDQAISEVEHHGIKRGNIKIGAMIEVGAATGVMLDKILGHVSFVGIGSNDLTQHILGVDRLFSAGDKEGRWERRFGPHNPAVLDVLCRVFDRCAKADIPASLCGELASIPFYAAMSVGAGATDLSISPRAAWPMMTVLQHLHFGRAQELVQDMINSSGGEEALEKLMRFNLALTKGNSP